MLRGAIHATEADDRKTQAARCIPLELFHLKAAGLHERTTRSVERLTFSSPSHFHQDGGKWCWWCWKRRLPSAHTKHGDDHHIICFVTPVIRCHCTTNQLLRSNGFHKSSSAQQSSTRWRDNKPHMVLHGFCGANLLCNRVTS